MEELLTTQIETEQKMTLSRHAQDYLAEIRKWANFLAIMGFIGVGFMALGSLFIGLIFSNLPIENEMPFPGIIFSVVYFLFALVYFFPVYFLYQFSVKLKTALMEKSEEYLESAFKFLKSHYKFIGILTIVMLALYPIIMIVAVVFGVMSGMGNY